MLIVEEFSSDTMLSTKSMLHISMIAFLMWAVVGDDSLSAVEAVISATEGSTLGQDQNEYSEWGRCQLRAGTNMGTFKSFGTPD